MPVTTEVQQPLLRRSPGGTSGCCQGLGIIADHVKAGEEKQKRDRAGRIAWMLVPGGVMAARDDGAVAVAGDSPTREQKKPLTPESPTDQ
mgnify:FL=1